MRFCIFELEFLSIHEVLKSTLAYLYELVELSLFLLFVLFRTVLWFLIF